MRSNLKLGLGFLTVLATPFVVGEVSGNEAQAAQGWVQNGSAWYHYKDNGSLTKNAWVGNYWLGADGRMITNSWVDNNNYYVGSNGVWVRNAKKTGWVQSGSTWYYYNSQGQLERNRWIGDYWVGSDGKMGTNSWVDNNNYYVGADGLWVKNAKKPEVKKTGWVSNGGVWYYYNKEGQMVKNAWVGNYWLGSDGKMATNSWVDNNNYYVGKDGLWERNAKKPEEKKSGWVSNGGVWYYYNKEGQMVKNAWAGDYYLGSDGKMVVKSWIYDNVYKAWYYLGENGVYKRNTWIGNYWVGANGKMATNSWVDNGRYYVGPSGAWEQSTGKSATGRASLDSVLNIARNYLGVQSGSEEHKKIVDAYNSVNPKPVGYTAKYSDDWCDIFVTTVFQQAGLSHLIGRECGVQRHIGILEQKGIWKGKTQPKVGDIVTFDWDGGGWADHIGIVESVNNGVITTIEGNSAQYAGDTAPTKVNRKTYNWDSRYIKGYARPMY